MTTPTSAKYRPSFVPNVETIHWDRITDARIGSLLKMATQELIRVNDDISEYEAERERIRLIILAEWQTADAGRMRYLNAKYRDAGKMLSNRIYWAKRISEQINLIAKERRRIFGAKPSG